MENQLNLVQKLAKIRAISDAVSRIREDTTINTLI